MGPLAVVANSTMCGLNDRILWEQSFGAAANSDLICRVKEVTQNRLRAPDQLPTGTLLCNIGLSVTGFGVLMYVLRQWLENSPDKIHITYNYN